MMMQQKVQVNYATASIFGSYINRVKTIPGRERTEEQRRKDKERIAAMFEIIEDYIEQA
ncbi:MAG: hypothetical protein ACI4D7_10115 [Lachnospiraceae bacterium]